MDDLFLSMTKFYLTEQLQRTVIDAKNGDDRKEEISKFGHLRSSWGGLKLNSRIKSKLLLLKF